MLMRVRHSNKSFTFCMQKLLFLQLPLPLVLQVV
jgi:hypothetical protein